MSSRSGGTGLDGEVTGRKKRRLRISVDAGVAAEKAEKPKWPAPRPDWVNGSIDDLVTIGWSDTWRPDLRHR